MSSALKTVLRLKQDAEQQAAEAVAMASGQVSQLEAQLNQMREYQKEYLGNWQSIGQGGITGSQNQSWHQFIGQLEQTITQLQQHLQQAKLTEQQQRENWFEIRNEIKAVEMLVDKRQQEEDQRQAKQEQKLFDELAGIRHFHQTRAK